MKESAFWTDVVRPMLKSVGLHAERVELTGGSGRPDLDVLEPHLGRVARVELKVIESFALPTWGHLPWNSPAQPIELWKWTKAGGLGGVLVGESYTRTIAWYPVPTRLPDAKAKGYRIGGWMDPSQRLATAGILRLVLFPRYLVRQLKDELPTPLREIQAKAWMSD